MVSGHWYDTCIIVCPCSYLELILLQWISTHPWVMLVCTICISKGRAYQGYTCHIACFSFLDTPGIYLWIYTGLYNFLSLFTPYFIHAANFWPVNGLWWKACVHNRMKLHIDFYFIFWLSCFFLSAGNTS